MRNKLLITGVLAFFFGVAFGLAMSGDTQKGPPPAAETQASVSLPITVTFGPTKQEVFANLALAGFENDPSSFNHEGWRTTRSNVCSLADREQVGELVLFGPAKGDGIWSAAFYGPMTWQCKQIIATVTLQLGATTEDVNDYLDRMIDAAGECRLPVCETFVGRFGSMCFTVHPPPRANDPAGMEFTWRPSDLSMNHSLQESVSAKTPPP